MDSFGVENRVGWEIATVYSCGSDLHDVLAASAFYSCPVVGLRALVCQGGALCLCHTSTREVPHLLEPWYGRRTYRFLDPIGNERSSITWLIFSEFFFFPFDNLIFIDSGMRSSHTQWGTASCWGG